MTLDQVTPIARLTSEYEVIVVPANSPIKDMKDLMARFKANPGSISWGGGSAGGTDHILAGLLAKEVGVEPGKVNYVPFKGGGEAVAAIIGGHVSVGVSGVSEFAQHIQSGKMRALGVSSAEPVDGIPTLKEQGFNVELANWRGIFGAPGITKAQQAELVKAVEAAHEAQVLGGHAQEAGLDALLARRRRVRRLRQGGDQAHRRDPRRPEPRQEVTGAPGKPGASP